MVHIENYAVLSATIFLVWFPVPSCVLCVSAMSVHLVSVSKVFPKIGGSETNSSFSILLFCLLWFILNNVEIKTITQKFALKIGTKFWFSSF